LLDERHEEVEGKGYLLEDAVIRRKDLIEVHDDEEKDEVRSVNPTTSLRNQLTESGRGICFGPCARVIN